MGKKFAVSLMVMIDEEDGVPAEHGPTLDEIGEALVWHIHQHVFFEEEIELPIKDGSSVTKAVELVINRVSYGKVVEIVDPSDRVARPRRRPRPSLATVPPVPGRSSVA